MYILASSVSDDQVPGVASQIVKFVEDFGGSDIAETQLGKKKLAYPIKKTRNGFYGVIDFSMDGRKVNDLDAKIRTQDNTIIRYILVNMDEHLERSAKDVVAQAKLSRMPQDQDEAKPVAEKSESAPRAKKKADKTLVTELNAEELDKKIDDALNEDIIK